MATAEAVASTAAEAVVSTVAWAVVSTGEVVASTAEVASRDTPASVLVGLLVEAARLGVGPLRVLAISRIAVSERGFAPVLAGVVLDAQVLDDPVSVALDSADLVSGGAGDVVGAGEVVGVGDGVIRGGVSASGGDTPDIMPAIPGITVMDITVTGITTIHPTNLIQTAVPTIITLP